MTPSPRNDQTAAATLPDVARTSATAGHRLGHQDALALGLVIAVAVAMWLPRWRGPIDMRWDGAVYFILGTSIAEGKGYQLLSEPGEIDEVHYPPLLPAIVALHQRLLGSNDPTIVGHWLRLTSFVIFLIYAVLVLRFLRGWLPVWEAVLGTMLSLFCVYAWFLSDLLFPELWFAIATLTFLQTVRRRDRASHTVVAYFAAVAAYALRTIGIVVLVTWVIDSVLHRRLRKAAVRAVLALLPVATWQMYVAGVERSPAYNAPAYAYQRAPYNFYNVSYATNVALRDPFAPEKGRARIERRVVRNALHLPVNLGETFTASPRYFEMFLERVLGKGPGATTVAFWMVFLGMSMFGGMLVFGGTAQQLRAGETLLPSYVLMYLAAMCLTPFPDQYQRYLMPIAPALVLAAFVFVSQLAARGRIASARLSKLPLIVLGSALVTQIAATVSVFTSEYQPVAYVDRAGRPVSYRLFYYGSARREYDETIDFIRTHARSGDVVAAGMPHWIHLRTGLKAVLPPLEADPAKAQTLLDSVPVRYLVIGEDVIASERYTRPVVGQRPSAWERVYSTTARHWSVYRRID